MSLALSERRRKFQSASLKRAADRGMTLATFAPKKLLEDTHTLTQSHLVNIGQLFVNLGPSCALLSDVETCKDTITIINVPQLSSFRSFVTQIQVRSQPRSSWVAKNNNKRSALQN